MWHTRRARFSTSQDDSYFPFSPELIKAEDKGVLSREYAGHMDPPISVLTNLYYPRRSTRANDVIIPDLFNRVSTNSSEVSRHFNNQEQYKAMTGRDMNYRFGWSKIIPNGMVAVEKPKNNPLGIPFVEHLSFNYVRTSDDRVYHSNCNLHELLAVIEAQIIKGGCPEIALNDDDELTQRYCCEAFNKLDNENNEEFEKLHHNINRYAIHQIPQCPTNDYYNTMMCDLDVNEITEEGSNYIHAFCFRPMQHECSKLIYQSLRTMGYLLDYPAVLKNHIAYVECGFMKLDAGLEMSASKHQREKRIHYFHPYLNYSNKYKKETEEFFAPSGGGISAPPMANSSQAWNMARWCRRMEKDARWLHSELSAPVKSLPIYDPSE